MIGLTRHFREKNTNDFIEIPINVVSPPTTYTCGFEVANRLRGGAKSSSSITGQFEIDWGDGSPTSTADWIPFIGHSYTQSGTYSIKVYSRDPKNSIGGWGFSQPSSLDWGTLDFSDYYYMHRWNFPHGSSASIILPTQYLADPSTTTTLTFRYSSGTLEIQNLTNGIFDTTQWNGFDALYSLANSTNFDRILLNDSNVDSQAQFSWNPPLVAVGPSASDLNNWDADFRGQNLASQFRINGTGITGATGNIQNILFGTTSFINEKARDFIIANTAITTLDVSGVSWWNLSNHWINAYNNPNLETIIFDSGSTVFRGDFYQLQFYNCNLNGHLDMSGIPLNSTTQVTLSAYNNPNLTEVTAPTGSSAIIRNIQYYDCAITTLNGFDTFSFGTEFGDVNSANYRLDNNSLDAAQVNKFLVDVNAGCTAGFTGRILNISSNTAPDGTSGGYDGTTAKSDLISKGWTVTTD